MIDKESVMKTYGANLRNLISAKGISQGEVADLCGTHQANISKICRSETLPTLPIAMEIADLFETSVSEMLGEVEADKYENSRYQISDEIWGRKPVIDKEELEAMELLHKRSIIDDEKYYSYITEKLKEIAE